MKLHTHDGKEIEMRLYGRSTGFRVTSIELDFKDLDDLLEKWDESSESIKPLFEKLYTLFVIPD